MTIALALQAEPSARLARAVVDGGLRGLALTGEMPTVTFLLPVGLLSLYSCGAHATGERAVIGLAIALAAVGLGAARTADATITDLTAPALLFTGAWVVGRSQLVRRHAPRAGPRRARRPPPRRSAAGSPASCTTSSPIASARSSIQAEAGRCHRRREPERAAQPFGAIARLGRARARASCAACSGSCATATRRRRTAPAARPGALEALLAETRAAGVPVDAAGRRRRRGPARRASTFAPIASSRRR